MTATSAQLYKAHVSNLRAVDVAFERVTRELNASLAKSDAKTADALLKTSMLLLGAWAENRLRKLMFEPNGFTNDQRSKVDQASTQLDSWTTALDIGFRKRHGIPHAALSVSLPITSRAYYSALASVFDNELRPIIEVRNKLAHGQWARALNGENTDFSTIHNKHINNETAHSIKCKYRILEHMAQIIHDLVAGNHAFERDFDKHFSKLENAKRDITSRSYTNWLKQMRDKYARGKGKRASSLTVA